MLRNDDDYISCLKYLSYYQDMLESSIISDDVSKTVVGVIIRIIEELEKEIDNYKLKQTYHE